MAEEKETTELEEEIQEPEAQEEPEVDKAKEWEDKYVRLYAE